MNKENRTSDKPKNGNDFIADVISSFKVGTYTLSKQGDIGYCHWSEGLKMVIEKDGIVMKLEGEEIEKIVRSLPRTFGGTY